MSIIHLGAAKFFPVRFLSIPVQGVIRLTLSKTVLEIPFVGNRGCF